MNRILVEQKCNEGIKLAFNSLYVCPTVLVISSLKVPIVLLITFP